jgi:hypothetical protein
LTDHDRLEGQVLAYLLFTGWFAWSTHGPRNRPATAGMPDILAVKDGAMLAVEVKAGKDKPSARQEVFLRELDKHGVVVVIAHSLDEVIDCKG